MSTEIVAACGDGYAQAIRVIRDGGVVALPTDTFYGLAVNPFDAAAVERLFELKARPRGKPIPLLVGKLSEVESLATSFPVEARRLADEWWPGPLTLVLQARDAVPAPIRSDKGTVGLRIARHPAVALVLAGLGHGVTGTSANVAGESPSRTVTAVTLSFPAGLDLVVDGGVTTGLASSTVVDCTAAPLVHVLREGAIAAEHVQQVARGDAA